MLCYSTAKITSLNTPAVISEAGLCLYKSSSKQVAQVEYRSHQDKACCVNT